jgi:hypothetical protein
MALFAMVSLEVVRASVTPTPPSDLEQQLAAETDPVARLVLVFATRCNPYEANEQDGNTMPPCDQCPVWQNAWTLPSAYLELPSHLLPESYDAPAVISWRAQRFASPYTSRGPPLFAL